MDFVLVHGAYHGSWCWNLLIPELERLGHHALAVDLPTTDPDAGAIRYAEVISQAAEGLNEFILVGHSMGGLSLPLVAHTSPVKKLVFLCALVPRPGFSMKQLRATEPVDGHYEVDDPEFNRLVDNVWTVGATTARELFFHDAPEELAEWVIGNMRPQCYRVMTEMTPLQSWPDVESAYIVCAEDRGVNPDWGRKVAREQLGVEPIEMEGGHAPYLTRPRELAWVLSSLA